MKLFKTLAFVSLFYISGIAAFGQPYQKFVVEQAHWEMTAGGCLDDCYGDGAAVSFDAQLRFKLDGDTLINNIIYKKFYASSKILWNSGGTIMPEINPWSLQAVLREDTANKKVYYIGYLGFSVCAESSTDTLLYDFSKTQGDSLSFSIASALMEPCYNDIAPVDSINYTGFDTFARKTFYFPVVDSYTNGFQLYEGIGPSYGLYGSPGTTWEPSYQSALTNYCVGPDSVCGEGFIPTGINTITNTLPLHIYPNPAMYKFWIAGLQSGKYSVEVYSVEGKLVLTKEADINNDLIDVSGLSNSVYLVNVTQSTNCFHAKVCVLK